MSLKFGRKNIYYSPGSFSAIYPVRLSGRGAASALRPRPPRQDSRPAVRGGKEAERDPRLPPQVRQRDRPLGRARRDGDEGAQAGEPRG